MPEGQNREWDHECAHATRLVGIVNARQDDVLSAVVGLNVYGHFAFDFVASKNTAHATTLLPVETAQTVPEPLDMHADGPSGFVMNASRIQRPSSSRKRLFASCELNR